MKGREKCRRRKQVMKEREKGKKRTPTTKE